MAAKCQGGASARRYVPSSREQKLEAGRLPAIVISISHPPSCGICLSVIDTASNGSCRVVRRQLPAFFTGFPTSIRGFGISTNQLWWKLDRARQRVILESSSYVRQVRTLYTHILIHCLHKQITRLSLPQTCTRDYCAEHPFL